MIRQQCLRESKVLAQGTVGFKFATSYWKCQCWQNWTKLHRSCRVAISLLQAYKDFISPLLPSVCRFQPSCSTYSVEAYQQFGACKGTLLMVWRLLRCNPFRGGYQGQYDPPSWPPVGLGAVFKDWLHNDLCYNFQWSFIRFIRLWWT